MRAETGAMRFEGDWRGVFIRGDNATAYAVYLRTFGSMQPQHQAMFEGLIKLLESSDERNQGVSTQQMKPFAECAQI
jgi:hypothetical protein